MSATDEKYDELQKIGKNAYESIAEMVAALECDYERLQELREERDNWHGAAEVPDDFPVDVLDDDDEAEDRATCGVCGRSWDDGVITSLTPAPSARCPFEDYHGETWAEANPDEAEELVELEEAAGECESEDDARQRIEEDPLSLQLRSGWYSPGETPEAEEFELLLGTGGPAVRIIGELSGGEPSHATLQAQDWFTAWTDYLGDDCDQDVLLAYCRCFCFGE